MKLIDTQEAIEVSALRKVYAGGAEAVNGIDFRVARGEVFGLLGPNGAGKSTTVGMLTTTIAPTSGSARLAGFDVVTDALAARRVSSVVFQEPVVDAALTGSAHLELHARLWGVTPKAARRRIPELIAAVGVGELIDRRVGTYSGGERRRLEIARALVSAPQVLFLDEPTAGLDPRIRHELLDVIASLREREQMTILLTTHYLDEAERLCDRVAIMHEGQIVALDAPSRLLAGLGEEILELRVGDPAHALTVLRARGIADDNAFAVGTTVTLPLTGRSSGEVLAALTELGISPAGISTRQPTLDDVYLHFTGAPLAAAA